MTRLRSGLRNAFTRFFFTYPVLTFNRKMKRYKYYKQQYEVELEARDKRNIEDELDREIAAAVCDSHKD